MFKYFRHKGCGRDNGSTIYFAFIPVVGLVFLGLINLWDFSPIQHYVTENFGSSDPFFFSETAADVDWFWIDGDADGVAFPGFNS